jgi:hypothetical protein
MLGSKYRTQGFSTVTDGVAACAAPAPKTAFASAKAAVTQTPRNIIQNPRQAEAAETGRTSLIAQTLPCRKVCDEKI